MTLDQVVKNWVMSNQPEIKILITKVTNNNWRVDLEEHWPDSVDEFKNSSSQRLDEAVKWAVKELDNWPGVLRKSYTNWQFRSKREAEKFKIIFGLKWLK